jgi:hypothetical protein
MTLVNVFPQLRQGIGSSTRQVVHPPRFNASNRHRGNQPEAGIDACSIHEKTNMTSIALLDELRLFKHHYDRIRFLSSLSTKMCYSHRADYWPRNPRSQCCNSFACPVSSEASTGALQPKHRVSTNCYSTLCFFCSGASPPTFYGVLSVWR